MGATPLVFTPNGGSALTIVSATTSDANFGYAHRVGRAQPAARFVSVSLPGVAGRQVKALGVADGVEVSRAIAFGSGGPRQLSRIYGSGSTYDLAKASLETWLATVETWRETVSYRVGTLAFDGRTYTDMEWRGWTVTDFRGIFNFAPGGTAKRCYVDFTAEFVGTD